MHTAEDSVFLLVLISLACSLLSGILAIGVTVLGRR